jgi:[ribosomal protein S5]-alanine N-acetyltransferase
MLSLNFIPFPVLNTERLQLRQLMPEDDKEILQLRTDVQVNQFLGRSPQANINDARTFITKINTSIANNESAYWGITLKPKNKLIGTICLWNIQPENYRAEIGYELDPNFWGKGIMLEALPKVIEYGFKTMNLHSIAADTLPENIASIRLLEKNGFKLEGVFKESIFFKGKFSDRVVYSLLHS